MHSIRSYLRTVVFKTPLSLVCFHHSELYISERRKLKIYHWAGRCGKLNYCLPVICPSLFQWLGNFSGPPTRQSKIPWPFTDLTGFKPCGVSKFCARGARLGLPFTLLPSPWTMLFPNSCCTQNDHMWRRPESSHLYNINPAGITACSRTAKLNPVWISWSPSIPLYIYCLPYIFSKPCVIILTPILASLCNIKFHKYFLYLLWVCLSQPCKHMNVYFKID